MTLLAASTPSISKDFFDKLVRAHPPVRAQPNVTTMDELMHDAGKQELIDWIREHAQHDQVIVNADVSRTTRLR